MARQSYYEMLRDPRWQKKRLEIMQRDNFACYRCGDNTTTLNVHHTYYAKGRKPWEYENDSLQTLCEPCHGEVSTRIAEIQQALGAVDSYEHARVLGYLRGLVAVANWPSDPANIHAGSQRVHVDSDEMLEGLADALGLSFTRASALVRSDNTFGPEEYAEGVRQEIAEQQAVAEFERRGVL